jgi:hypothetical protein
VPSTVCRSNVERLITFSTSAVAVCCCSDSRSSFSSRVFSMAMTAWLAKLVNSAICLSLNGRGRGRTKTGRLWVYTRDDPPWGGPDPPGSRLLVQSRSRSDPPHDVASRGQPLEPSITVNLQNAVECFEVSDHEALLRLRPGISCSAHSGAEAKIRKSGIEHRPLLGPKSINSPGRMRGMGSLPGAAADLTSEGPAGRRRSDASGA